jgi:tetratricopeptide (TPR) repeat protein
MRLTLLIASVLLVSSTAFAQVGPDVEDPWETARSYYSEGNYAEAQRYIVESIQREPRNPMYYAGLARARWGQGDVDQAVYYYDVFLSELADEVTADIPVSYRPSSIRTERDQANAEREDPDAPVDAPEHLVAAMDALNQRIAVSRAASLWLRTPEPRPIARAPLERDCGRGQHCGVGSPSLDPFAVVGSVGDAT